MYFKEKDFIKGIPSSKFYHDKMMKTLALSNKNPNLKTYLVYPGLIYGYGEDLFYDYLAWNSREIAHYWQKENTIPTIYI